MHNDLMIIIIVSIIASLVCCIVLFLGASVVRRIWNDRRYEELDTLRREFRLRIAPLLDERGKGGGAGLCAPRGSLAWQALEEVLLEAADRETRGNSLAGLFIRLGYVAFYEDRLRSRNVLIRASAIDKLGRMRSPSSTPKLLPFLDTANPELLSVTVRALSRIGAQEGLASIVQRLPDLLTKSLVTRKTMETALLNFGAAAIAPLIAGNLEQADPWVASCVLETLSHLQPDSRSVQMAITHLQSPNPEVRSKALKVLGRSGQILPANAADYILPLLDDPVWFVRLQAIKSAGAVGGAAVAVPLGKLLFDTNWHVRSEAVLVLARFGDSVVDVFLDALRTDDVYAKESICEEIEITGFADRLIEHLDGRGRMRTTSGEILRIMHSRRFSSPLTTYLETGQNERIKTEVRTLLAEGARS